MYLEIITYCPACGRKEQRIVMAGAEEVEKVIARLKNLPTQCEKDGAKLIVWDIIVPTIQARGGE